MAAIPTKLASKLQIFVLAGQSNMQGHGLVDASKQVLAQQPVLSPEQQLQELLVRWSRDGRGDAEARQRGGRASRVNCGWCTVMTNERA